jgi:predicted amidophosphoribosyltransferase
MAIAEDNDLKCSKCEKKLDTEGTPRWCKKCRADYQREYQGLKKEMSETRGYAAGCSAMREFLSDYFKSLGNAHVSGFEASVLVGRAGVPR